MKNETVLVVAPHPDDETLGCGGTLLRHLAQGDSVHWLIVTDMSVAGGYPEAKVRARQQQIDDVAKAYPIATVTNLGLAPASLDTIPMARLVESIAEVVETVSPGIAYLPFWGDAHTDHAYVFDAAAACTKWFRHPSLHRVACYETVSETEFGLRQSTAAFAPNSFVDITPYIQRKADIAGLYVGEMLDFPFPRSAEALQALARVRGATCGCHAAEAFMVLREFWRA